MLELKDISIRLKCDDRSIIENFSFTLMPGDKAVIIGEEGNGKSTLLKFVYDPSLISDYCEFSGKVITNAHLAYLPQMMPEELYDVTLAEYFGETEYYYHFDTINMLGLDVDFLLSEQKLGTLSGGEKVKVQLCRMMMDDPDVLLLDEPTNDLDIETLTWLEDFISDSKLPVLYISHDETLIEKTANVILHMEQLIRKTKCRMTVTRASYRDYLASRRSTFDHQEQVAHKQRADYAKQMERWRRIYERVNHEQSSISRSDPSGGRLLKKKMHSVQSMGKRFEREKENFVEFPQEEEAIITKFDESISLPNGKIVLDLSLDTLSNGTSVLSENIELTVTGGEIVGITGRNGAGKSTLLKYIWELLSQRTDIIASYMPQNYADVLEYDKTPIEHLASRFAKEDITRARTFMGSMRFTHEEMTGKIGALSGGQRAKILFLDMVLKGANVLVLDEPTRNFSPLSSPVVRHALADFGGTIISISHDRKYLTEVCDTVYELDSTGLHKMY